MGFYFAKKNQSFFCFSKRKGTEKALDKMNLDELKIKAISVGFTDAALEGKSKKELVEMIKAQQV